MNESRVRNEFNSLTWFMSTQEWRELDDVSQVVLVKLRCWIDIRLNKYDMFI